MEQILNSYWLSPNMLIVYAFFIEGLLRLLPTPQSFSILAGIKQLMIKLHELIDYILPDNIKK
jgi:hypothetical protein